MNLESADVDDNLLESLLAVAESARHGYRRDIKALILARQGKRRAITSTRVAAEMVRAFLNENASLGWVFVRSASGRMQPFRVADVLATDSGFSLVLDVDKARTASLIDIPQVDSSRHGLTIEIDARSGHPEVVLEEHGVFHETATMRHKYREALTHYFEIHAGGTGTQVVCTGPSLRTPVKQAFGEEPKAVSVQDRRCVLEGLAEDPRDPESVRLPPEDEVLPAPIPARQGEAARLPVLLTVDAFDLTAEADAEFWTDDLRLYQYDPHMKDKLVMPATHTKIIDVVTGSTEGTMKDLIFGRGSGNLILCKGEPGVGKTLTAHVVAEVLQRPIYTVDASSLIAEKGSVRRHLDDVFERVRRWDGVLLFDEADVILGRRGDDLERNRVTSELLRSLEEFERLAFLTTNRPDDVDDAILSRCIAIIEYVAPMGEDARRAWKTLGDLVTASEAGPGLVTEEMARDLAERFPGLAPREIKQLLRLSLAVATGDGRDLDVDLIEECSVFRGWASNMRMTSDSTEGR